MHKPADGSSIHCAYRGPHGEVRFARVRDGSYPAERVWNAQSAGWQAKFMSLFVSITSNPLLQLRNRQQFKQVEGRLFEFKRNDVKSRVFAFRDGSCWYLVHCFTGKKEDDLPKIEIGIANRLMQEAMDDLKQVSKRSGAQ